MICCGEPRNVTKCSTEFTEFFRGKLWSLQNTHLYKSKRDGPHLQSNRNVNVILQVDCLRTLQVPQCGAACQQSHCAARLAVSDAAHDAAPSVSPALPSSALSTPSHLSVLHVPRAGPSTVALHAQEHTDTLSSRIL